MKNARQQLILEAIAEETIETQGQLLAALERRGVTTTQATISRDMKDLRLVKEINAGGEYHYTQASGEEDSYEARQMEDIVRKGCVSFDHAMHTVVIKTMPGLASAVCGAIDAMEEDTVLGTVAGDDTGVLIMRNTAAAERLCNQLRRTYRR